MSSVKAYSNKKNVSKKYCKVCHDAGKSEVEYTSHYIRESSDPNSKVVCPVLLSTECQFCFNTGHTVKYCAVLADNKKKQEKAAKLQQREQSKNTYATKANEVKQKSEAPTKKHNAFAYLSNDSDSDNEAKNAPIRVNKQAKIQTLAPKAPIIEKKHEEFPALPLKSSAAKKPENGKQIGMSYASMASKPQEDYLNKKYEHNLMEKSKKRLVPRFYSSGSKKIKAAEAQFEEEEEEDYEKDMELFWKAENFVSNFLTSPPNPSIIKAWADYDTEEEQW